MSGETNKPKYAPGPWHLDTWGTGREFVVENCNQGYGAYTIAEIPESLGSDYTPEMTKANAQLIAAAPELLEALEDYVKVHEFLGHADRPHYQAARKAIAKAKGETK